MLKFKKKGKKGFTESPTSLNKSNVGIMDEERNRAVEKIGIGSKIGVENGDVFAVFDIIVG